MIFGIEAELIAWVRVYTEAQPLEGPDWERELEAALKACGSQGALIDAHTEGRYTKAPHPRGLDAVRRTGVRPSRIDTWSGSPNLAITQERR